MASVERKDVGRDRRRVRRTERGVALAERGFRVAVLEGKPALGGRAYSFADPDTGDFVDNGQHVLMGCYTETLDFLETHRRVRASWCFTTISKSKCSRVRAQRDAADRAAARSAAHERPRCCAIGI